VTAFDPMRRVLEAADAVDRAIDERAPVERIGDLRLVLDESFAAVLDTLGDAQQAGYRAALVEQYVRLSGSLDAFERRAADPA
jgi:hypothetical protein